VQLQVTDRVFKIKKNPMYKNVSELTELLAKYQPADGLPAQGSDSEERID
jgi:hypothetical protein